jgi:REase_MTES_1575/Transcriptional regulator, AbiEi antitoxin
MPSVGRETGLLGRQGDPGVDSLIAALADAQHGVVSLPQLRTLGLSANAVVKRAKAGRLHRVYRGVYAVGRANLDARGRRMAAVLACGPGAVLSHKTAADALGLLPRASARIELSVPGRVARNQPGLLVHRPRTLQAEDCTTVDGIPCTTVARTLLDLAAVVSAPDLARAIEGAEKRRVYDGNQVEAALARAPNHPGTAPLRAALVAYSEPPPTREEFERRAFEVFAQAGLGRPQVNVLVETSQEQLEVDFCWPDRRLIVEADSWEHHKTRAAFERDRRRDQLLRAAGWTVIRITWRQLNEAPEEIIASLAAQ